MPMDPRDRDIVHREVTDWVRDGLITPEQARAIRARYPGHAAAPARVATGGEAGVGPDGGGDARLPHDAGRAPLIPADRWANAGFAERAFMVTGAIVLVLAFVFLVAVYWDELDQMARAFVIIGIGTGLAAGGFALGHSESWKRLGHALLAPGLALVAIGGAFGGDIAPPGGGRIPWQIIALIPGPIGLALAETRRAAGVFTGAFITSYVGFAISLGLAEADYETHLSAMTMALLLGVAATGAAVSTRRHAGYGASAAIGLAALAVYLMMDTFEFNWNFAGDYTGHVVLLLPALAGLVGGIPLGARGPVVVGCVILVADAVYLGVSFGGVAGAILVLFITAGVLIGTGGAIGRWLRQGGR